MTLPDESATEPFYLSSLQLYRDMKTKQLAPDVVPFEPRFKLWSDGAQKERFLVLPAGQSVDSSDMDHWFFPVGTMLFKQFSLGGKRLETRLIERTGENRFDYWMGSFVWNEDETDAVFTRDGAEDVGGTNHDVPSVTQCGTCHNGEAGRVLGFSAAQLASDPPQDGLRQLIDAGRISPAIPAPYSPPGDEATSKALGYLHANCGHCHNPNGSARPDTDMVLRLALEESTPESTEIYRSTVGVSLQNFLAAGFEYRVVAGSSTDSAIVYRMGERDGETQMPPLGTELVDDDGIASVRAWIDSLSP